MKSESLSSFVSGLSCSWLCLNIHLCCSSFFCIAEYSFIGLYHAFFFLIYSTAQAFGFFPFGGYINKATMKFLLLLTYVFLSLDAFLFEILFFILYQRHGFLFILFSFYCCILPDILSCFLLISLTATYWTLPPHQFRSWTSSSFRLHSGLSPSVLWP